MQIAGSFGISYHGDNQNEYNQQNIALIFSLFCRLYSSPRGDGNQPIPVSTISQIRLYSSPRGDGNKVIYAQKIYMDFVIILIPARGRKQEKNA